MAIERRWHRSSTVVVRSPATTFFAPATWLSAGVLALGGQSAFAQALTAQDQQAQQATDATGAQQAGNAGVPRSPWRFRSSVSLDETYSDNINLTSKDQAKSDLVTSISPGLNMTRYGSRLTAFLDYNPQLLFYARGTNGTQVRNYLDARGDATLIENLLYFDAQSTISQSSISPFGTQAANSVNGSSNRAEQRTYSLGPTLKSRFGSDLSYQVGYRYTTSSSDSDAYSANHTSQLFGSFQSGTTTRNIGYGATYSYLDENYGDRGQIIVSSISGNLTYQIEPTVRLQAGGGYDRNRYPTTGEPDLKGPSYTGGVEWSPSQHTHLSALFGHRYFGPTANVTFSEVRQSFSVSAIYSRDQTTSAQNGLTLVTNPSYALVDQYLAATIPDPVARQQAVYTFLQQSGLDPSQYGVSSFLSNQLYLQKRAEIDIAFFGQRNSITFSAQRTEQQVLSNVQTVFDIFDQAQRFRTTGYSANYSHQLGPRTSVSGYVSKTHNTAIQGTGDTKQRVFSITATRQFGRQLSGAVTYRNTAQVGNGSNELGNFYSGNYRENEVLGSLRLVF